MLGETLQERWAPRLLGALRIVAAFLFASHGSQKLLHVPPLPPEHGPLPTLALVAGMLELAGGLLLLLGAFTRPVAFLLSGEMAVAYFLVHAPRGFWPLQNQGELAALYSFLFLYFAVAGGGAWSVDRLRAPR